MVFGLEGRDKIRARSHSPAYRYYWFPAVAALTAMISGAIYAATNFYTIPLIVFFYLVAAAVIIVPSAAALISLLVYCPRVATSGGNIAFRSLSIVLAVVIALVVYQVWKTTSIEVAQAEKYAWQFVASARSVLRA